MEFNIKQLTSEQLDNLFHGVIHEMNVRKAEKQNVDVGFWDSTGEYKESIEEITIQELNENIQPEEKQDEPIILPVNITALQKLVEQESKEFINLKKKIEEIFSDDSDYCERCPAILEYKDLQIRNLKKRIDAANNFISEYACKNCPGSPNHCPECKFNDITVALQIGRPSCQFLNKKKTGKVISFKIGVPEFETKASGVEQNAD